MSAKYTKLCKSILSSSLWWRTSDKTRLVWITLLALAAGKKGIVSGFIPDLAYIAHVAIPDCEAALAELSDIDPYSRDDAFEGRRIEAIPNGWRILNYEKYHRRLSVDGMAVQCPHNEIIALYHKHLPMCPQVRVWDNRRKALLKSRWSEDKGRQDVEWWSGYFTHISRSAFLTGHSPMYDGHRRFVVNLEWLIRPSNLIKVFENLYHEPNEIL
ncbi:MAG: hypothetical protein ACRD98_00300 [Nitrososphaera sp.]